MAQSAGVSRSFPRRAGPGPPRGRPRSVRDVIDLSLRHRRSDSIGAPFSCAAVPSGPQQAYTTQTPSNRPSRASIVFRSTHTATDEFHDLTHTHTPISLTLCRSQANRPSTSSRTPLYVIRGCSSGRAILTDSDRAEEQRPARPRAAPARCRPEQQPRAAGVPRPRALQAQPAGPAGCRGTQGAYAGVFTGGRKLTVTYVEPRGVEGAICGAQRPEPQVDASAAAG